jgi:methylenetetrahydrofolate dehydrogenase (NADP+)/methenyltetrahydrofolate cyclohydrolase
MTQIIDGRAMANALIDDIAKEVLTLKHQNIQPCLAVVLVGEDPASAVYVRNKVKRAKEAGIVSVERYLDATCSQNELEAVVDALNNDSSVHGILVQLPLPKHLNEERIIQMIRPYKDVDGFHPENVGRVSLGQTALTPCTPQGCMMMLRDVLGDLSGKHAVVIGRSNIVGKPMANLLLGANCTVTTVHSKSKSPANLAKQADIVVAAVGVAHLVDTSWIAPNAVVIDVGINAVGDGEMRRLVGDVDFAAVKDRCLAITPVPGGVGPMTIACLMKNTVIAAKQQSAL